MPTDPGEINVEVKLRPGAAKWIADSKRAWRDKDGTPNLAAIAADANVNRSTVWKIVNGVMPPGTRYLAHLPAAVARARRISREAAMTRIFEIVDIAANAESVDELDRERAA